MNENKYKNFYYYLFDWANSPFSTIVITFVFSSYFTNTIANNKISGTSLWGWTIALSGFFIAILSPYLGYLADSKKSFLKTFLFFYFSCCFFIFLALVCYRKCKCTFFSIYNFNSKYIF